MGKFTSAVASALKSYFETGDKPTQAQFGEWIDAILAGIQEHGHVATGGAGTGTGDAGRIAYSGLILPSTFRIVSPTNAPYSTIQAAINAASSDDILLIGPGTYTENVTISKNLTLLGLGRVATPKWASGGVVINGTISCNGYSAFLSHLQVTNTISLQNGLFTLDHITMEIGAGTPVLGLDIQASAKVNVLNSHFSCDADYEGVATAIQISGSGAYAYLNNCYVRAGAEDGTARALYYAYGYNAYIRNCTFEDAQVICNTNGAQISYSLIRGGLVIAATKTAAIWHCGLTEAISGSGSNLIDTPYNVVDADL